MAHRNGTSCYEVQRSFQANNLDGQKSNLKLIDSKCMRFSGFNLKLSVLHENVLSANMFKKEKVWAWFYRKRKHFRPSKLATLSKKLRKFLHPQCEFHISYAVAIFAIVLSSQRTFCFSILFFFNPNRINAYFLNWRFMLPKPFNH